MSLHIMALFKYIYIYIKYNIERSEETKSKKW